MEFHEYANLFPMMTPDEVLILRQDMRENGYREEFPIILYENKILDGRNRYVAALAEGIAPVFRDHIGGDPLRYVIGCNLHRRHLNESQRAVVAAKLANMPNHRPNKSANLPTYEITQAAAAEMLNVSERAIRDVKAIEREAPELLPKMEGGELTAHAAMKEIKIKRRRAQIETQRAEIKSGITEPGGLYDVISIDPPWPYGTDYDPDGRRAASPYPEMSLEEIAAIHLPAAPNCIVWLWTTHKFMRYSFAILDTWGFRDVAILTWEKDRIGLGAWLRSRSEFAIMAVRGQPIIDLTNQSTVIHGALREHSRKPEEFYQLVESLCIGRKLDYFSRQRRSGWDVYGNDTGKFYGLE
jgi:N6-adenosine-specific RNA methylase IME4